MYIKLAKVFLGFVCFRCVRRFQFLFPCAKNFFGGEIVFIYFEAGKAIKKLPQKKTFGILALNENKQNRH